MTAAEVADTVALATALLKLGRAAEAAQLLRASLRTDPENLALLRLLALALLQSGHAEQAHTVATQAVAADPTDIFALSCLGAAAAVGGDYRGGLAAIDQAVAIAPSLAGLHRQRAEILLVKGDRTAALTAAQHARRLNPADADSAVVLGRALVANGRAAEGRREIEAALRLEPDNADAHAAAGLVQLRQGGGKESIAHYREALRLDPTDAAARAGMAAALKSRNPAYRALLLFTTWLEQLPPSARWAVLLAPLVLSRVLLPVSDSPVAQVILALLLVFVAFTWVTEPIANLILMTNRGDRRLLSRGERWGALVFLGFACLAISCFVGAFRDHWLIPYGFGFGLWAMFGGSIFAVRSRRRRRIVLAAAVLAVLAGVAGLVCLGLGVHNGSVAASAVLFVTAVPVGWTVAFSR